jgi:hypothetical protein
MPGSLGTTGIVVYSGEMGLLTLDPIIGGWFPLVAAFPASVGNNVFTHPVRVANVSGHK